MTATEQQIRELASTIEAQAHAIVNGAVIGPRYAAVTRLQDNIDTLRAWIPDDRDHTPTPRPTDSDDRADAI